MSMWPTKDPGDVLDYGFDYSNQLEDGVTIVSSSWTVPEGLTVEETSFGSSVTTVRLSGGEDGGSYSIDNDVTTSTGDVLGASAGLQVRAR